MISSECRSSTIGYAYPIVIVPNIFSMIICHSLHRVSLLNRKLSQEMESFQTSPTWIASVSFSGMPMLRLSKKKGLSEKVG